MGLAEPTRDVGIRQPVIVTRSPKGLWQPHVTPKTVAKTNVFCFRCEGVVPVPPAGIVYCVHKPPGASPYAVSEMCRQQYKFYLWDRPLNSEGDNTRLDSEIAEATQDLTRTLAQQYGITDWTW